MKIICIICTYTIAVCNLGNLFILKNKIDGNTDNVVILTISSVLNGIKVRVFFEKYIKNKHLCQTDNNYDHFCKSKISVIKSIVGSRNMVKVSKSMSS